MRKALHYAYPTSPIAQKYGYCSTGCWYITINGFLQGTFTGDNEASKTAAIAYFESLPHEGDLMESFTRESLQPTSSKY